MIRWEDAGNGAGTVHLAQDDTARVQPPSIPPRAIHDPSQAVVTGYHQNPWAPASSAAPTQQHIPQPSPLPSAPAAQQQRPTPRRQPKKRKLNTAQDQQLQLHQQQQQQQVAGLHPTTSDRLVYWPPALPSPAPSTSVPTPPPPSAHQHQQQQQQPSSQPLQQSSEPPRPSPTVATSTPVPPQTPPTWSVPGSVSNSRNSIMPQSPGAGLAPPPEGIFRTFEDLLTSVQRVAKDQGYGIVKLRSSNYREGKPTRFDLVCDRGGVKYNSTAKKRNPTTRKVDCPWRGKAVCEVQLGMQWRFVVQEPRHNHEPRIASAPAGAENASLAANVRSLINKVDRMNHEMTQGFHGVLGRINDLEKRLDNIEQNQAPARVAMMGGPGDMLQGRLQNIEARMASVETRQNGMEIPMDDVETRLLASTVM